MSGSLIYELFHPGDRAGFVVYDALRSCCLYEKHLGERALGLKCGLNTVNRSGIICRVGCGKEVREAICLVVAA